MNNKNIILHLSLIDGIGPATIASLCSRIDERRILADLYACSARDIVERYGIAYSYAEKIVSGLADRSLFEKEYARIEQHAISWTTILDASYPSLLRTIYAPPSVLYWQGTLPADDNTNIALVGSRKANRYGETAIQTLVSPLVQAGWRIVSGGALGADSMAHEAALQARGTTISVLGSGLLRLYPRTNLRLFERIVAAGGALVSSFPLTQEALPGNFPARNRIIAGMSKGCVVIQAAQKSGARITALFALEQGREVFAIPGMIDDPLAQGCNMLIQEGAKLVMQAGDILSELDLASARVNCAPQVRQMSLDEQSAIIPAPGKATPKELAAPTDSTPEGHIVRLCKKTTSTDELLIETGLTLVELNQKLFDMSIEGLIAQNSAGMWELGSR